MTAKRIALLGSYTLDFLRDPLKAALAARAIDSELHVAGYNQFRNEILNPASSLYAFAPEIVVLLVAFADLVPDVANAPFALTKEDAGARAADAAHELHALAEKLHERLPGALVFVSNCGAPIGVTGLLEGNSTFSVKAAVRRFNNTLEDHAAVSSYLFVIDYELLEHRLGTDAIADNRLWYLARARQGIRGQRALASLVARYIKAATRAPSKVLVLDLDNTLWGGIVGEDGPQGIALGQDGIGRAYVEFQREVKNLASRGVLLAISSKNNRADAMEVLDRHPEMVLKSEDFAVLKIDWRDKATHLREIAETLDVGLDSLVFVDDNPVERELIRTTVPAVTVIDMPADAGNYRDTLIAIEAFDTLSLTEEDRQRGVLYRQRTQSLEMRQQAGSLEDFLRSLGMTARISCNDDVARVRIAQLTQKTNQFNLTTRRYSEADITSFMGSNSHRVYAMRLRDKFGDNGLIGVAIVAVGERTWTIDTFLMSCRVIGRGAEDALLAQIMEDARECGATTMKGEYIQTAKNALARDFLGRTGFVAQDDAWIFDLAHTRLPTPDWIQLEAADAQ